MRQLPDHPDIESALRTGYPRRVRDVDLDVDDEQEVLEDLDGYHNEDTIYEERREKAYGWE